MQTAPNGCDCKRSNQSKTVLPDNTVTELKQGLEPGGIGSAVSKLTGGGPIVVENRKGVFSRYPKKESGSWEESDRGGTRLCEKVHNVLAEWKVYWDLIG